MGRLSLPPRRSMSIVRVLGWHRNASHRKKASDLEELLRESLSSSPSDNDGKLHSSKNHDRRHRAHVPKGFLPVYVGPELARFVIPAAYLSLPEFKDVMKRAEEEFGFQQDGALTLPCSEAEFDDLVYKCKIASHSPKTRMLH